MNSLLLLLLFSTQNLDFPNVPDGSGTLPSVVPFTPSTLLLSFKEERPWDKVDLRRRSGNLG